MKPLKIYIAHPYCPKEGTDLHDASRVAQHNVDESIIVANKLIEMGHYVFVPLLSHYVQAHYSCTEDYGKDWWYAEDLTFLDSWADAIIILGDSFGTRLEEAFAKKKGLKIYHSIREIEEETL